METLLQVDATYGPSERITLSDAQEAGCLPSMKDQGDEDVGHRAGNDEKRDEPAEVMPWNFHDFQSGDRWGAPALQAIRDLCTN